MRKQFGSNWVEADFELVDFGLWVHGREFPSSTDYWDGNWLRVTARVETPGAKVETSGPIIRLPELVSFRDGLQELNKALKGEAHLDCLEPDLDITIKCDSTGHLAITVTITPDHLLQSHRFTLHADQTILDSRIASMNKLLSAYPVRNG